MMTVIWDLTSMTDRETIFDFIEQDNFNAAIRVDDDAVQTQAYALGNFPEMGR